jgi:hypothetical protein
MSIAHLAARARGALALALASAALVAFSGCTPGLAAQPNARIQLTATDADAASTSPGQDMTFHVTLNNAASSTASSISLQVQLDPKVTLHAIHCTAAGTTCPSDLDAFIYPITMPAGASLTIDYAATAGNVQTGAVENVVLAAIIGGPAIPPVTSHGTIVETRGGHYQAFASDGTQVGIDIDFGALDATFTGGPGAAGTRPFVVSVSQENFEIGSSGRFTTPADLLVGNADFGAGPRAFVAARQFATTIAELDGLSFTTFGLDTQPTGAASSHVIPMWFTGSALSACVDATPRASMDACPAASQRTYALTVDGNVFTGVDAAHADTTTFQVAKSGATWLLLDASSAGGAGARFRIGVPMAAGALSLANNWFGSDASGDWAQIGLVGDNVSPPSALNLSLLTPAGSFEPSVTDHFRPPSSGPAGLWSLLRANDSAPFDLVQSGPLMLLIGDPAGNANGFMAVLTPVQTSQPRF